MTSLKSKDDVLTLFVHLGYLAYDKKTREVFIPNKETLEICKRNSPIYKNSRPSYIIADDCFSI